MKVFSILGFLFVILNGCMENQQSAIKSTSQALTEDQRSCSTAKAEGYLQGAVIKADPTIFEDFTDEYRCQIPFVDLYQYVNGVYSDAMKTYCQNYFGPSECTLPREITNCFYQLQAELFDFPVVLPSEGYKANDTWTNDTWTWEGLIAEYVIKTRTLKEALDIAMGYVDEVCQKKQGDAIEKIVNQLRNMPVSKNVRDIYPSLEKVNEALRKTKTDSFFLLKGYTDNCFKTLGYLLPPEALYNHFPLPRSPEIDLATASQPYKCDSSQYSMCRVLSVAMAETGNIITERYTYRFSQGILALRQMNDSFEFEKENTVELFDKDHPYL